MDNALIAELNVQIMSRMIVASNHGKERRVCVVCRKYHQTPVGASTSCGFYFIPLKEKDRSGDDGRTMSCVSEHYHPDCHAIFISKFSKVMHIRV